VLSRLNLFRKPISLPWRIGLGVASIATFAIIYTIAAAVLQSKLVPTWYQLWTQGVLPSFVPQDKGLEPLPPDVVAARAQDEKQIETLLALPEDEQVQVEKQRLKELLQAIPQRLEAEQIRLRAVDNLMFLPQHKYLEVQKKALDLLPEQRAQIEEVLEKVRAENKNRDEKRIIWEIRIWEDMKHTFWRLFVGLGISVLVSVVLGVLMGCYAPIDAYLYPPLAILAKIPATVTLGLFFVIAGLNENFYLSLILFGIIPTLTQTIYIYTKEVPEELLFKARTLGASQMECIFSVILPNILPKIVESVRLGVGPALIFLYAAETIRGDEFQGLGCTLRLVLKKGLDEMPTAYFYLVCIAAFGFIIDYSFRFAQKKLFPWYYSE
jgi:NitT/TauT family transport system permease protein